MIIEFKSLLIIGTNFLTISLKGLANKYVKII